MAALDDPKHLVELVREGRRLLAEAGASAGPLPCPGCQRPAAPGRAFCTGCGARLEFPCPRCEAGCRAGQDYCGGCGVELSQDRVAGQLETLDRAAEAERQRREADLLRRYERTRTLSDGRLKHLLGTLADGSQEFVKVATRPAGRRLLRNEIATLQRLGDLPGVIRLLDHQDDEDRVVAVFEHVARSSLRYPLAIPRVLGLVAGTLRILADVHAKGVVHADLKPEHVLARGPDVVLIDWNIAQESGPSLFGAYTPMFAAPEQVVGDRLDPRVDLYAVGVMLYLLFTHDRFPAVLEEEREPEPFLELLQAKKAKNRAFLSKGTVFQGRFQALNALQTAAAEPSERTVLGAKFLFSSELSRTQDVNAEIHATGAVLAIVQRATAVDPADRYPDAAAMLEAVEAVQRTLSGGGAC